LKNEIGHWGEDFVMCRELEGAWWREGMNLDRKESKRHVSQGEEVLIYQP
jgi:hypothetical protein